MSRTGVQFAQLPQRFEDGGGAGSTTGMGIGGMIGATAVGSAGRGVVGAINPIAGCCGPSAECEPSNTIVVAIFAGMGSGKERLVRKPKADAVNDSPDDFEPDASRAGGVFALFFLRVPPPSPFRLRLRPRSQSARSLSLERMHMRQY